MDDRQTIAYVTRTGIDGERFLMIEEEEDPRPHRLILVQNFFEDLKRPVPN